MVFQENLRLTILETNLHNLKLLCRRLGRQDSNLGIVDPKSTALPLGHARTVYESRLGGNPRLCIARLV